MKKKIIGILVCIILLLPMLSVAAVTNESPITPTIRGETKQATCYFYGQDGSVKTCVKEIPEYDAEKLRAQLQAGSKAFVTLYSSDASDKEIIKAKEIIDSTLLIMDELGMLPEGITKEEAKQIVDDLIFQARRLSNRGIIGSAGVGLLRPIRPVIAFPKLIVCWTYLAGATFSVGLRGIKAKLGPQFGFALFFVGFVASIGVTGAFFGYTPFTFYL